MAERVGYQLTRRGEGFAGRPSRSLRMTTLRLRRRLRRIDPPYTVWDGEAEGPERSRPDVIDAVTKRLRNGRVPTKLVVRGASYDQPAWAVRSVHLAEPTHPFIAWGSQWVGRTTYQLGGSSLPGPIDCSGFTLRVVEHVTNGRVNLPHLSDAQRDHPAVDVFYDADNLKQGDLVFLNYGRLRWPTIDHVEFHDRGGRTLGSRPSTRGVGWYSFGSYDRGRVVCYGRIRV